MSASFDGGLERGTVLLEINRQRIDSIAEYRRVARAVHAGDVLALYVYAPGSFRVTANAQNLHFTRQTFVWFRYRFWTK